MIQLISYRYMGHSQPTYAERKFRVPTTKLTDLQTRINLTGANR